jgi:hypothetical protein
MAKTIIRETKKKGRPKKGQKTNSPHEQKERKKGEI